MLTITCNNSKEILFGICESIANSCANIYSISPNQNIYWYMSEKKIDPSTRLQLITPVAQAEL
jgi:hypothetical protein